MSARYDAEDFAVAAPTGKLIELRKKYPSGGGTHLRRVTVEPWSESQFVVRDTGSEVSTLHANRAEAYRQAELRAQTLERKGWVRTC